MRRGVTNEERPWWAVLCCVAWMSAREGLVEVEKSRFSVVLSSNSEARAEQL